MYKIFIASLICICIGLPALLIAELVNTTVTHRSGTVVGKHYTPASTSSGTGVSSSGKPVYVSTHEAERWTLLVDIDGAVMSANASPSDWSDAEKGMPVDVAVSTGNIFGSVVNRRASLLSDKR